MVISVQERILQDYKNNCESREDLTEFDKGYHKALVDVMMGKYKV